MVEIFLALRKRIIFKKSKTMRFKKRRKEICLWCGFKKTGNYILAYDVKGLVNCWCCFDCYKKLAPKLKERQFKTNESKTPA
jgi:hypothetical protein